MGISRLAKIPTFIVIGSDFELRKGLIIELHIKEGGFKRHSLYYTKCRAICFSIIKSLLTEFKHN